MIRKDGPYQNGNPFEIVAQNGGQYQNGNPFQNLNQIQNSGTYQNGNPFKNTNQNKGEAKTKGNSRRTINQLILESRATNVEAWNITRNLDMPRCFAKFVKGIPMTAKAGERRRKRKKLNS